MAECRFIASKCTSVPSYHRLEVDLRDAALRVGVASARAPATTAESRFRHLIKKHAPPLAAGRQTRAAPAGELEGQRLFAAIRVTERMRAQLSFVSSIETNDLTPREHRLAE
jgi:hypothetical protein